MGAVDRREAETRLAATFFATGRFRELVRWDSAFFEAPLLTLGLAVAVRLDTARFGAGAFGDRVVRDAAFFGAAFLATVFGVPVEVLLRVLVDTVPARAVRDFLAAVFLEAAFFDTAFFATRLLAFFATRFRATGRSRWIVVMV